MAQPAPTPVESWEEKEWAFDDAMRAYQQARTARARRDAITAARIALEDLYDELDRIADALDKDAA